VSRGLEHVPAGGVKVFVDLVILPLLGGTAAHLPLAHLGPILVLKVLPHLHNFIIVIIYLHGGLSVFNICSPSFFFYKFRF
jgi:hypothetical protein